MGLQAMRLPLRVARLPPRAGGLNLPCLGATCETAFAACSQTTFRSRVEAAYGQVGILPAAAADAPLVQAIWHSAHSILCGAPAEKLDAYGKIFSAPMLSWASAEAVCMDPAPAALFDALMTAPPAPTTALRRPSRPPVRRSSHRRQARPQRGARRQVRRGA